jgi:N-succinyldiaminopimelate aminotransferase
MLLGDNGELSPTIFAEMSALAISTGSINLGQGFPDEDGPADVLEAAREAISAGLNQYPPGTGMPVLREAIAAHQRRFYGLDLDPDREVLVTAGATEALAATLLALTEPGDEVVTLEPFYDSYAAIIGLAGATHVTVPLRLPDFLPDPDDLRRAISDRTRVILLNSPHNPTGSLLPLETLRVIIELAEKHDAIIVTDEVYEHLVFDGVHVPAATLARHRTVSISSGGKTFNTTGWKIGWITAPPAIVQSILAVKQFLTFVNGAPFQPAIAVGLGLPDEYFATAAATLRAKRDILARGLERAGFGVTTPQAGYFIIADASPLGIHDASTFARQLPIAARVVGIPVTAFVRPLNRAPYASLLRFAFCKRQSVLEEAAERLAELRTR